MKRKLLPLIIIGAIVAIGAGLIASGVVDGENLWRKCRSLFYRGKSAAQRATQIKAPAARDPEAAKICRANLKHIENAKRKVAEAKGMATGRLTWNDILPEMPGGRIPKCPAGGEYSLMDINTMPRCSIGANQTPTRADDHLIVLY